MFQMCKNEILLWWYCAFVHLSRNIKLDDQDQHDVLQINSLTALSMNS